MTTACPNKEKNLKGCTCTYNCDKLGMCCECVTYHRNKGQIPGCFFTKDGEVTWNRSAEMFCKDRCGA